MVSPQVLDRMAVRVGLPPGSVGRLGPHDRIGAGRPPGAGKRGTGRRHRSLQPALRRRGAGPADGTGHRRLHPGADRRRGEAPRERRGTCAPRGISAAWRRIRGLRMTKLITTQQIAGARGGMVNAVLRSAVGRARFLRRLRRVLRPAAVLPLARPRSHAGPTRPRPASPPESAEGEDDWPRTGRLLPWLLAGFVAMIWLVPFNSIELDASLPDRPHARPAGSSCRGRGVDRRLRGGGPGRATYAVHLDTRRHRPVRGLRVPQRGVRRPLPQPDARARALLQEAAAARVLRLGLRDRRHRASAQRGAGVPELHVGPRRASAPWGSSSSIASSRTRSTTGRTSFCRDFEVAAIDRGGRGRHRASHRAGARRGPARGRRDAVPGVADRPGSAHAVQQSGVWRILYGLAACVLIAATFATYRKSAVLAPVAVVLTLAYFRRRELLKLAPLGMVLVVMVSVLSPGAAQVDRGPVRATGRAGLCRRSAIAPPTMTPSVPTSGPTCLRPRLGELQPRDLPDTRLRDSPPDARDGRAGPGGLPADGPVGDPQRAKDDRGTRSSLGAGSAGGSSGGRGLPRRSRRCSTCSRSRTPPTSFSTRPAWWRWSSFRVKRRRRRPKTPPWRAPGRGGAGPPRRRPPAVRPPRAQRSLSRRELRRAEAATHV